MKYDALKSQELTFACSPKRTFFKDSHGPIRECIYRSGAEQSWQRVSAVSHMVEKTGLKDSVQQPMSGLVLTLAIRNTSNQSVPLGALGMAQLPVRLCPAILVPRSVAGPHVPNPLYHIPRRAAGVP